jgi:hypothetical protein
MDERPRFVARLLRAQGGVGETKRDFPYRGDTRSPLNSTSVETSLISDLSRVAWKLNDGEVIGC